MLSLKIDWIRHTTLAVSLRFILFLHDWTSEKSTHYVLAHLLYWFGVHLFIENLFKQTFCVICFTKISLGCFTIWPVDKNRHYVLANSICLFKLHLVTEEWLKPTLCVRYFTKIHFLCFLILPVHKTYTMC